MLEPGGMFSDIRKGVTHYIVAMCFLSACSGGNSDNHGPECGANSSCLPSGFLPEDSDLALITSTSWILSAYVDNSGITHQTDNDQGEFYTLEFDSESETSVNQGKVFGQFVCNDYGGSYFISDGTLRFSDVLFTEESCMPNPDSEEILAIIMFDNDLLITDVLSDRSVLSTGDNFELIYAPLGP